ncbi:MAG: RNA methyltransferase [Duncaniella sp.]|nr:RNA methyltransferase [Duncaniella sp.]
MLELTNAMRKMVAALDDARHRRQHGLFKAEGMKIVEDTLPWMSVRYLMVARQAVDEAARRFPHVADRIVPCSRADLERMTSLTTPRDIIAVYELPDVAASPAPPAPGELILALDDLRDPGNMGTILRMAAWMGIKRVWCSRECVDVFNPKVVQGTMGAIARVKVSYCDLPEVLAGVRDTEIYGTFLDGENLYTLPAAKGGVIVIGNEGHGISDAVAAAVTRRITIPAFTAEGQGESLNAAVAAAITVAEFRRKEYYGKD